MEKENKERSMVKDSLVDELINFSIKRK